MKKTSCLLAVLFLFTFVSCVKPNDIDIKTETYKVVYTSKRDLQVYLSDAYPKEISFPEKLGVVIAGDEIRVDFIGEVFVYETDPPQYEFRGEIKSVTMHKKASVCMVTYYCATQTKEAYFSMDNVEIEVSAYPEFYITQFQDNPCDGERALLADIQEPIVLYASYSALSGFDGNSYVFDGLYDKNPRENT